MERQFAYKAWANAEILDALARIDASRYPEQRKLAIRLVNHTHVVDRIFAAHLSGARHGFQDTNTPETPTVERLREQVAESDAWYRDYVGRLDRQSLHESIAFIFTDGDSGTMTREEILFHVLAHGTTTAAMSAWCWPNAASTAPATRSPASCMRPSRGAAARGIKIRACFSGSFLQRAGCPGAASAFPSPARGRRWRKAPDEGLWPVHISPSALRAPSPTSGRREKPVFLRLVSPTGRLPRGCKRISFSRSREKVAQSAG
ncbi:DinB family protein [[Pseudomonas] boreopolis]|uniref:DinB family protein n=1 Tax=Xanthomonas boreopolis TaxID=86183 RepID=UPI003DA13964